MDRRNFLKKLGMGSLAVGGIIGVETLLNKPLTNDEKNALITEGAVWLPYNGNLTDKEFTKEFDEVWDHLKNKIYIAHFPYRNGTLILIKTYNYETKWEKKIEVGEK